MVVQENHHRDLLSTSLKNDKKHRLKQRFDVKKKLGQGTYGKVQLAVIRETGQEVAIKTIKKIKIENEQDLIRIRREIQIMSSIQHPHLIHIYEVFENKDKIVLVMQFASGGELYDYLSEKKVLGDSEARRIFRQIAAAVYYCHKNKICHRDLKLENILLDEKGNAKIADFGLSNVFDERHLLKTYCGSPLYASPEIVKGVPYYGPEVDCWSMGVLLYTLVYGAMPFDGSNFKKLVTQISEGDYFEPKKKSKASSLIQKLLTVNPVKRATIVDICTDWWVNQGYEHSLLQVAEDMANLTPVRLDLLLALAPASPIPPEGSAFQEHHSAGDADSDAIPDSSATGKDIQDDVEEDYDDDDDNTETVANSFAYVKGSRSSHISNSSPNLLEATKKLHEEGNEDEDEFLPADVAAALEAQGGKRERSFDGSLVRMSSLAHQNKKTKKSDSSMLTSKNIMLLNSANEQISSGEVSKDEKETSVAVSKHSVKPDSPFSDVNEEYHLNEINKDNKIDLPSVDDPLQQNVSSGKSIVEPSNFKPQENDCKQATKGGGDREKEEKDICSKGSVISDCSQEGVQHLKSQKRGSFIAQDEIASNDAKKTGRHPGKIIIPKTFSSPQNSPSPKSQGPRTPAGNNSINAGSQSSGEESLKEKPSSPTLTGTSSEATSEQQNNSTVISTSIQKKAGSPTQKEPDTTKTTLNKDSTNKQDNVEEKKIVAKGILKKGIAKAKLAERRMSQQSSFDSDIPTPSTASVGTPDVAPSFFKSPKPYKKDDEQQLKSNAEIVLNSAGRSTNNEVVTSKNDSLWEHHSSDDKEVKQLQSKSTEWNTLSSTLDSEMSGWRQQLEESLRKLSPEESERASLPVKNEDDKPLVPIARSYKKFTFTKDGACITETKKIYATPGADGSWTKVEKKTKITTRPGNSEEFEKFRDLHLRNDSPLVRSDSQSSSGSTDIYDDIFDSWTGDTMLCNMMKMNNVFQKFSRDPFLRRERRRNPFRQFRRAESERNERERRRPELKSGHSTDKESSDNEEDYDVHFDSANPVVYGSQGLWQFLRSTNRGFPGHVSMSQKEPSTYTRSFSQERSGSKYGNWKSYDSKDSSGYNTGTRSHSRDRTESPREKVLRFVFDSPRQGNEVSASNKSPGKNDSWSFKRTVSYNPRRDSGVGSDGYESEHSVRRTPSDDVRRSGQVSPLLSSYTPDIFRNLKKTWPREFTSPAVSPPSVKQDVSFERPDNLAESRRHRVEQWLHMSDINNPNFPFDTSDEFHSPSPARNSPVVHGNKSTIYGTMRPREYMRYYRSSSDKIADFDFDYFPTFDESQRSRSIHNLHKDGGFSGESSKMRQTGAVYSPVSEESSHGTRSVHHSDSSHSNSSVHRINFTISDGRISTSHMPSHSAATKFSRSQSSSGDGRVSEEGNFRVEKGQTRNVGHPIVQMKVSFNRDNRESPVIHLTSQSQLPSSKGLWQQQDKPSKPLNMQERSPPVREISPIPGIRKFSTEIVHPVSCVADSRGSPVASNIRRTRSGSGEKSEETAFEYENVSGRDSPGNLHRGKNRPCSPSLVCDFVPYNACLPPSMESLQTVSNTNIQSNDHPSAFSNACSARHTNKLRNFDLESPHDMSGNTYHPTVQQGTNTPDSLEDIAFEDTFSELRECGKNIKEENDGEKTPSRKSPSVVRPNNSYQLEIKPLGVLWDHCKLKAPHNMKKCSKTKSEFMTSQTKSSGFQGSPVLPYRNTIGLEKNKNFNNPKDMVPFNQKQTQNKLDLLSLLSDDGFDNFRSTMGVLKSSHIDIYENKNNAQNVLPSERLESIPTNSQDSSLPHSILNERISVIDSLECDDTHKQRLPKIMPSFLDDLQSPKEVLRQAMKLCDAFGNYK